MLSFRRSRSLAALGFGAAVSKCLVGHAQSVRDESRLADLSEDGLINQTRSSQGVEEWFKR